MKTMVYREYGSPEVISIEESEKPIPKDNEILIRIRACAANDWDIGLLKGDAINRLFNGISRPQKKHALGSDVAGEIESVGRAVQQWKVGDRVYGDLSGYRFGGFAEYVCAREKDVAIMPDGMSFAQAAAIPQAGVLATQALLDYGQVKPGQSVLINGAGGGVGTLGIQVLKAMGEIEVTGVDSGIKLATLRDIGFDHVIDYQEQDFTAANTQYDLIVDTKTNRSPGRYLRVLKPNGIYATVGGQLWRVAQLVLFGLVVNKLSTKQLKVVALKPNKDLAIYNKLFIEGNLKPVIDGPYPLEDLPSVFERYIKGIQVGKIVVTM